VADPNRPESLEPYLAVFDFLAAPLEEVQANFTRFGCEHGLHFVPGFFEDTLPHLPEATFAIVRLDSDTYESTLLALRCLYPRLSRGGIMIIDDYAALDECRRAVDRFRDEEGIVDPLHRVDWTCVRWQRSSDPGPVPATTPDPAPVRRDPISAVPRERSPRIPTTHEVELEARLTELRAQLRRTESELSRAQAFEARYAEVTSSTSWRVTRPLRELGRHLRS
jgi:hypothetical protein